MSADHSIEIFRQIPGFPEWYRVSNWGRVQTCASAAGLHVAAHTTGDWRDKTARGARRNSGHVAVQLYKDGKNYCEYVHRLVLLAFVGPCPDGMIGLHSDGDASNNRADNLRWGTASDNMQDALKHGAITGGTDHPNGKLSHEQVDEVRRLVRSGVMQKDVAARFSVSRALVCTIMKGKRRTYRPDPRTIKP